MKTVIFCFIMLVSCTIIFADGVQPPGNGTAVAPYQVSSLDHLLWISTNSGSWDKHFIQTSDIDAAATVNWNSGDGFSPIGNSSTFFAGVYDGQGHTISNLFIDRQFQDLIGFFGTANSAEIKNLNLTDADITGNSYVGIVAGTLNADTTIENCSAEGSVYGQSTRIGGLVGSLLMNSTMDNCSSKCEVSGSSVTGGLIGQTHNTDSWHVINCYSISEVTRVSGSSSTSFGVFIGQAGSGDRVENCYAVGNVYYEGTSAPADKGFIGSDLGSFNTYNNFWDSEYSNQTSALGAAEKTTKEMNQPYIYLNVGWDFLDETVNGTADHWGINPSKNGGYPFLAWQGYLHFPGITPMGTGTESDPYQIASLNNLLWLSNNAGAWSSGTHIIQTADINASDTEYWYDGNGFYPLGYDEGHRFYGIYDGQGYSIDNLYIKRDNYNLGFFGWIRSAVIKNLHLTNAEIIHTSTSAMGIGIITGRMDYSIIENCSTSGSISSINQCIGGIVGDVYHSGSEIRNSFSNCTITGELEVGGLIGYSNGTIVTDCYCISEIHRILGGNNHFGSFIGRSDYDVIENCYALGNVYYDGTTNPTDKGFCGYMNNTVTDNNFWDSDYSNQSTALGATAKTTAEMHQAITYLEAGWDFADETMNGTEDNWTIISSANNGYPALAWQGFGNNLIPIWSVMPSGSGTSADPYQIDNAGNLYWLSLNSTAWDKYFIQTSDIDATATSTLNYGAGFSPIGNETDFFVGVYDGQGCSIEGLYINRPNQYFIGFFGKTNGAEIRNISFTNADITGSNHVGVIVGYSEEYTSFVNCSAEGSVYGQSTRIGGLVGSMVWDSTMDNCYSGCNVTGNSNTGGLIGECYHGSWHVVNCYSISEVTRINGSASTKFGLFIGQAGSGDKVENCYAVGNVYYEGTTDPTNNGFIGSNLGNFNTYNNFWDSEFSNQSSAIGATAKTTAEMQAAGTFIDAGWDFKGLGAEDIWNIGNARNSGYPYFDWQYPTDPDVTIVYALSPSELAEWTNVQPTLKWRDYGIYGGYYLSLGTDNPPANIISQLDISDVNIYSLTAELDNSTTYFWQVEPYFATTRDVPPVWSFTTQPYVVDAGNTFDFDSASLNYLQAEYSEQLNPQQFTISMWVKADNNPAGYYYSMITSRATADNCRRGYVFYINPNGEWEFWLGADNHWSNFNGGTVTNEWTHLAGTFDGTTQSFYVNGEWKGSLTTNYLVNDEKPLRIAAGSTEGNPNHYFDGKIDEVRIWNYTRTQNEIQQDMNVPLTGSESGLNAYWRFDSDDTQYAWDAVGQDHVVLINSPLRIASDAPITGSLDQPQNVMITVDNGNVTITWDAVPGASSYQVYSCENTTGIFSEDNSGSFDDNQWTAPVTADRKFYYIKACSD